MTVKSLSAGLAVLIGLAVAVASPTAKADPPGKHDSNTLHKIGKAIQYPVNKAGQNASIDAHRALGHNSVVHRRNGNRTYNTLITPKGHLYRVSRPGHHGTYRRMTRHHTRRHHRRSGGY